MPVVRRGDFLSGLALAALGAFIVREAWGWEYLGPDGPGAGFFPRWYGMAMVALSLVLVVRSVRAGESAVRPSDASTGRALACWGTLLVCTLLSHVVGFYASFALLCWAISTLLFRQRQHSAIALAAASALVFWLMFDLALGVALPRGAWWT